MESVSDTYAGNAGVRSIAANYKKYRFFPDESFWIYCAVITIFYILMHSVEYEKKSNWDMYRATFQSMEGRLLFQNISLVLGS